MDDRNDDEENNEDDGDICYHTKTEATFTSLTHSEYVGFNLFDALINCRHVLCKLESIFISNLYYIDNRFVFKGIHIKR